MPVPTEEELIEIPDDELMLTTLDNPHNPKENYERWRKWDRDHEYYTEEYLARVANIPIDVEDPVTIDRIMTEAMMEILELDPLGRYKLI